MGSRPADLVQRAAGAKILSALVFPFGCHKLLIPSLLGGNLQEAGLLAQLYRSRFVKTWI
jgi:hypothetical protein